jgi:hypothetical protein
MAKRIKAAVCRNFETPEAEDRVSPHGSQVENALIKLALESGGWGREGSGEAGAAFLPSMVNEGTGRLTSDGNTRGRGPSFDGHRPNPGRSCGGDFLGIKAPARRAPTKAEAARGDEGSFPSSVELFSGPCDSAAGFLEDVRRNHQNGKAFPLAIVHIDGRSGRSKAHRIADPILVEWCIRDYGDVITKITNAENWPLWAGIPVKPVDDRDRGRGGSPASVWVVFERRHPARPGDTSSYWYEKVEQSDLGTPGWNIHATLNTSVSARSGARFIAGSHEDFARDVDAATVLR